jgi:hypothetical protein
MSDKEQENMTTQPPAETVPAAAVALLADLVQRDAVPCSDDDFDLLTLIVDEALRGVDVPERYPAFWRKMMANAELHTAFLDCLEILEASHEDRLWSWPANNADTPVDGENSIPPTQG